MKRMSFLMTRRSFTAALALAAGPLAPPSSAAKVRAEALPGADFARYKTFQFLPPKVLTNTGVVENHPVLGPAVSDAVAKALTQCGLTQVKEGGDLQIVTMVLTASIPQLEAVVFGGPDMMYATPIATMGRYNKEGTLVVNLIDARTKKSAWVGMIQESIDNKPGAGVKKLPGAAEKLFKKYPTRK